MSKTKIAIACQGGGSQTAFTAGVLKTFFENGVHQTHDIMSLSGTSGGAVCAALAWYGLLKVSEELSESLDYVTKLSRQPELIRRMMQDGKQQASAFLKDLTQVEATQSPS